MSAVDAESAGTVDDIELICRGAFAERHYAKSGKIKKSLITASHLLHGELSVYRASEKAGITVVEVADQLQLTAPSATLKEIYAAPARRIRQLGVEWSPGRFLCIVDDARINEAGDKHRAHAHIQLCRERRLDEEHPDFVGIRDQLYLLFISSLEWTAATGAST